MELYQENINMQEALIRESKTVQGVPAAKSSKVPLFINNSTKKSDAILDKEQPK